MGAAALFIIAAPVFADLAVAALATETTTVVSTVSQATLRAFQRQLAQHGRASLQRSLRTFEKRLAEHIAKAEKYRKAGGYTSSVETEIRIFRESIEAIKKILGP